MPQIPIPSPLDYLGVFFLICGLVLALAGIGIISIEKITIKPGKKTLRVGIMILIVGFIFLLPTTIDSLSNTVETPSVTLTSTSIPTVTFPAATSTVFINTETPTTTLITYEPPIITPTPPNLLFFDDFSSNKNKWLTGRREKTYTVEQREINNGRLEFNTYFIVTAYGWINIPNFRAKDFFLTVDAEVYQSPPGSNVGIIVAFRHAVIDDRAYIVTFNNDSTFTFRVLDNGDFDIKHQEKSTAFDLRNGNDIKIGIRAEGQRFTIFANDHELLTIDDNSIRSIGEIGLGSVGEESNSIIVTFDNLTIVESP